MVNRSKDNDGSIDGRSQRQIAAISECVSAAGEAGIDLWLRGGWAVDFLIGRLSRPHEDVDFYLRAVDVDGLPELLGARGYTDVTTAPREQQRDFEREGVELSFALVRELDDGRVVVAGGPYADSEWPTGMLDGPIGELAGIRCAVISVAAQIEIKEMTPVWIPGRPRRQKDLDDIDLLRRLPYGRGTISRGRDATDRRAAP